MEQTQVEILAEDIMETGVLPPWCGEEKLLNSLPDCARAYISGAIALASHSPKNRKAVKFILPAFCAWQMKAVWLRLDKISKDAAELYTMTIAATKPNLEAYLDSKNKINEFAESIGKMEKQITLLTVQLRPMPEKYSFMWRGPELVASAKTLRDQIKEEYAFAQKCKKSITDRGPYGGWLTRKSSEEKALATLCARSLSEAIIRGQSGAPKPKKLHKEIAATIAVLFHEHEYDLENIKKWVKYKGSFARKYITNVP